MRSYIVLLMLGFGLMALPSGSALGDERVKWRFEMSSDFARHRSAVAADGSVYVNDVGGTLYALAPDGSLRWTFDTGGQGSQGPVTLGADGTVYVAGDPLGSETFIHALNPDGSLKWTVVDPDGQGVIAGPNVGPDGNIYVVTELPALSAFALSPAGDVLWNVPGFIENGQVGEEIVFGNGDLYFCLGGVVHALDDGGDVEWSVTVGGGQERQVAVGPEGHLYVETFFPGVGKRLGAFDANGDLLWQALSSGTNALTAPDVGADGAVYIMRNTLQLFAFHADGTTKWVTNPSGSFGAGGDFQNTTNGPIVSPDDVQVALAGSGGFGQPGGVRSFDARNGSELWRVEFPLENGQTLVPHSRVTFSPDSQTVYVSVSNPQDDSSYFYAIDARTLPLWTDLGSGLAGGNEAPCLTGSGALAFQSTVAFELTNATPLATATFVVGTQAVNAPFKGGVLVPSPELLVAGVTDAAGALTLSGSVSLVLPSGLTMLAQTWLADSGAPHGYAASNAIMASVP